MSEKILEVGSALELVSVARQGGPWLEVHVGGDHRVFTPGNVRVVADAMTAWLREHHPEHASDPRKTTERRHGERGDAVRAGEDLMVSLLVWLEPDERLAVFRDLAATFCKACGRVLKTEAEMRRQSQCDAGCQPA